jgi:hypothetical protein
MFHLFKKTYLSIDSFINKNLDRIVISKDHGFQILNNAVHIFSGRLFAYGENVDDIIKSDGVYPTFTDMMQFCFDYNNSTDSKIVIYCDQEAFMYITSKWFKTIFVNISADAAYKIILAYFNQLILIGGRAEKGLQDQYREFLFSKAEFQAVFDSISVTQQEKTDMLSTVSGFRSIEYLIGSYLYNGSHKEELRSLMYLMINRYTEERLKELWRQVQESILYEPAQQQMNLRSYNLENMLEMIDDPQLHTLKSTNAWRSLGGVGEIHTPMDITSLTASQVQQLKDQVNFIDAYVENIGARFEEVIDICHRGVLSDSEMNSFLSRDKYPLLEGNKFWSARDKENIRGFLVEYFMIEKKYNRHLISLAPFELE